MTPREEFNYDLHNMKDHAILYAKYELLLRNINIVDPVIMKEADKAFSSFNHAFSYFSGKWAPKDG
jgi:hypothetical protein